MINYCDVERGTPGSYNALVGGRTNIMGWIMSLKNIC